MWMTLTYSASLERNTSALHAGLTNYQLNNWDKAKYFGFGDWKKNFVNTSKERNVDTSEVLVFAKSGPVKLNQG